MTEFFSDLGILALVLGLFVFLFFGENVELFVLFRFGYPCLVLGFLYVCLPRKILGLQVCWKLSWLLVYGFISLVYFWFRLVGFLGFISCFFWI